MVLLIKLYYNNNNTLLNGGVRDAHLFSFWCFPIMCFYVLNSVLYICDVRYDFRIKTMLGSSVSPVVCRKIHVLFTLFELACAKWCPTYIIMLCLCFVCLCLVHLMLPVSLDCLFLIDPSVISNVY